MNSQKPHVGYAIDPSKVKMPLELCKEISEKANSCLVDSFNVPARCGKAWKLMQSQTCKFLLPEGAQVGDVNLWNLHNYDEKFYSGKTRAIHQSHLSVGDRLWSTFPYLRPMATIVADSLAGYTPDEDGCGVHDVLGTRCDPYTTKLITGELAETSCHQILVESIKEFGLNESNVHDVFNIFLCSGLNRETHQYMFKGTPARKGDFIETYAEMDLLIALAVCPSGDVSIPCGETVPKTLGHPMEIIIGQA